MTMTGRRCRGKDSDLRRNTDPWTQMLAKNGEDGGEKGELKSNSGPPLLCIARQPLHRNSRTRLAYQQSSASLYTLKP